MDEVRILATGLGFPEGPVAMPDGSVILTEIRNRRCARVTADGKVSVFSDNGGGPNGLAVGPDGALYCTNNGGSRYVEGSSMGQGPHPDYKHGSIQRLDRSTGAAKTLYVECDGHKLSAPNDLVFDTHGGFYFTDLGKTRAREMDRGAVYYAKADGSMIKVIANPTITANGCALSPDGRKLYFAETESGRLWEMDVVAPGEVRREPWPSPHGGRLVGCPGGYQRFDSMAVDGAGNICVATLINGGITVFSPDRNGWKHIPMPDLYTTNICFGGPDLRTAYVTLSGVGKLVAFEWDGPGLRLNYQ
jgi:gluconolactonase